MYRRYLMILVYAGAVCWILNKRALQRLNDGTLTSTAKRTTVLDRRYPFSEYACGEALSSTHECRYTLTFCCGAFCEKKNISF